MVVADETAFRGLPCRVAVHRAGVARIRGDIAASMAYARRALELVGDDDLVERGGAAALLGLAYWTNGDLDEADRWYADGMTSLEKAGYVSDVIGGGIVRADIRLAQGRLTEALAIFQRGLERATEPGRPVLRGAADMHVGISAILRERDDLDGATQHLGRARDLGEENGLPKNPYRSRVAAARIRQGHGDLDGALDLLADAERLYVGDFHPDVRPVPALKARVWIAQGNLSQAWGWARERHLSAGDSLSYLHEFEHITLARLMLAQGSRDGSADPVGEAVDLLERLLAAATDGGRVGTVIEIRVVQALARLASDDAAGAIEALERAVALAEPEGYVRVFIDEGPPMAGLLKQAAKQRNAWAYVRRLLAAAVTTETSGHVDQELIEPLSERELEVLRLLESDLDGPDMARELTVSLNTVRTHTKNIYAKLGVNSRRAAVSRAGELGLLSRTADRRPAQ
jgi:LuxR family maltose regulon positive regulatory protein